MPPICLHFVFAKEAAAQMRHPAIDQYLGSYLLGATSPDVHIVSGGSRKETHFFDLEAEFGESGVSLLFKAHPHLRPASPLSEATRAFIAGYLSHLVTDEVWILDIYRPFFGKSSPIGSDPMANLLDRALQFELDYRQRLNRGDMAAIKALLGDSDSGVDIGFIDAPTLRRWRGFICIAAVREPTWERFPAFARRLLVPGQEVDPGQLKQFLDSVPAMLDRALQLVTPERITAFREKAVASSIEAAEEYLR